MEEQNKPKRNKTVFLIVGLMLVLISIGATVFLVQQRQEIRKEAKEAGVGCSYNFCLYAPSPTVTPSPIPTPGAGLVCVDLTKDIAVPQTDETVTFTCIGNPNDQTIDHFNFRYQIGDGEYVYIENVTPVAPIADQGKVEIEITEEGSWHVQCQVCNNLDPAECTEWGAAQ